MYINWEGIKEFLGWKGTTEELKRLELPPYEPERPENNLGMRHIPLPLDPATYPYRLRVQEGDLVYLPNGKDTGTVYMIQNMVGDYIKIVSVQPTKKRRWFGLRAAIPLRFGDNDINQLQLIATQEEWDIDPDS